jgi:hypothetical protein
MTTAEFLAKYADNLMEGLIDGSIGLNYITIECGFCPLRELCEKDAELCPDKIQTCAEFFQEKLSDAKVFRK